jgi:hypothetical protein
LRAPGHKKADAGDSTDAGILAGLTVRAALLRQGLRQSVALVLDVDRDLGQRLGVLAAVMRTEQQFPRVSE